MYGYGPYTGCPMPVATPATGYALAPYGYGGLVVGAEETQPSFMDKLKIEGDKETFGVKRKYIALGAVGIGGILLASAKGWI